MTNDIDLLMLPLLSVTPAVQYGELPDEAAVHLVAALHDRATASGQPFRLVALDHTRHPRGLCVGIRRGKVPIAVFYLSEDGDYGWCPLERIHVLPVMTRHLVAPPVETGMHYWFRASGHGPGHIQAEPVGPAGPLRTAYEARHALLLPRPSKKPARKRADEETGAPPALHPLADEQGFVPLESLDALGL